MCGKDSEGGLNKRAREIPLWGLHKDKDEAMPSKKNRAKGRRGVAVLRTERRAPMQSVRTEKEESTTDESVTQIPRDLIALAFSLELHEEGAGRRKKGGRGGGKEGRKVHTKWGVFFYLIPPSAAKLLHRQIEHFAAQKRE